MIRIKRLFKSFAYAFRGLLKIFREEQNLRIQTFAAAAVLSLGVYFRVSRLEWCFLIIAIGLVILMEIVNSAIEMVSDVLKPRINSYVKEIKDIMAAAVMFASFISVLIGLAVFWPYFF
jgi:undecaprenol kinase